MSIKYKGDVVFCPYCGVRSLIRDYYGKDHGKVLRDGRRRFSNTAAEFNCTTCHRGFRLNQSLREEHAISYFAEHRKKRVPNSGFTEETA